METYRGHVRTPADAIKLFEACRLGLLPRVQRRLSEKERQSINSGSVFVWDEREAGMRRWTDGKSWSASRVSGSFLTYREMEGKRGGGSFNQAPVRRMQGKTPESGRGSDEDQMDDGDGPDGYRYKPDGLMKQSFSITTSNGQHLHLISYYSRPHPNAPDLPQPTSDPQLRNIVPVKGMYPESTVHEASGPAVTRTPMQNSPQMQYPQQMQQGPPPRGQMPYQYQGHPPPGYGWPPSPISTPPFQGHYPGPVYPSQLPPPPQHSPYQQGPNSAHAPPYPQHQGPGSAHTSPYQSHQQEHQNAHLRNPPAPMAHMHHQQTAFDRPPPPLSDSSLPPPPSHRGVSTATLAQMPMYATNPSPRVVQGQAIADHQAYAQRALQQQQQQAPLMVDPRLQQAPIPSLPPVQLNDAPQTNGAAQSQPQSNGIPRTSTPPQVTTTQEASTPQSAGRVSPSNSQTSVPTSQAQSIPSISHLVHATDSVSVINDNKSNSSRTGSKSPKDESKPRDIPHEKLNTRFEDRRAISVLDRKFHIS